MVGIEEKSLKIREGEKLAAVWEVLQAKIRAIFKKHSFQKCFHCLFFD